MKILLSAIACNPVTGSDAYFGWSVVRALASLGEIHVLTHGFSRQYISETEASLLPGVRFHFLGTPRKLSPNGLIARVQSWEGCRDWQDHLVLPYSMDLHAQERFKLCHHVTISSWRLASPLWKLGIPLVWGPLGGGEKIPSAFRSHLSPATRGFELFRDFVNLKAAHSRPVRECANNSTFSLAANQETADILRSLGCARTEVLSSAFFSEDRVARFRAQLAQKTWTGPLQIFSGGNLEGRKGVALSLRALAVLKTEGVPFRYQIGGGGAERTFLQKLAVQLGLNSEDVVFGEGLTGSDYDETLRRSHVYLLPSLRENAGLTLMEGMLAGCVPIVLKLGGPGDIVTEKCGFPILAEHPGAVISRIVSTLCELHRNRFLFQKLSEAASERIALHYSESSYLAKIQNIYRTVASDKKST